MEIFLIVLIIITCALLVLVVLAQNPKGGGLASNFGGAGSSQLMGVKKTGDLLERLTWGFAIALIILSLSVTLIMKPAEVVAPEEPATTDQPATKAPATDKTAPATPGGAK
ncbi:MAG TPA: preprotein translocase subunit SecG [Cytophagaceae bacterium]|jgi:preprotein translocase subunit SecG|nr:preprotein translocase subunit SecG [Cytophagaceae bacterium]